MRSSSGVGKLRRPIRAPRLPRTAVRACGVELAFAFMALEGSPKQPTKGRAVRRPRSFGYADSSINGTFQLSQCVFERVLLIGIRSVEGIRATGTCAPVNRPDTWQHRLASQHRTTASISEARVRQVSSVGSRPLAPRRSRLRVSRPNSSRRGRARSGRTRRSGRRRE
jgi:hypothetical protein